MSRKQCLICEAEDLAGIDPEDLTICAKCEERLQAMRALEERWIAEGLTVEQRIARMTSDVSVNSRRR